MRYTLFLLCLTFCGLLTAQSFVEIENRWQKDGKSTYKVHVQNPAPAAGPTEAGWWSKDWIVEDAGGGFVRFKNRWRKTYLLQHVDDGPTELAEAEPGYWSAQWQLEPAGGGFYRIKNRWRGTYLHIQQDGLRCGPIEQNWWSAMWKLNGYKGATKPGSQPDTKPQPNPQPQPQLPPQVPSAIYPTGAFTTPAEQLAYVQKITSTGTGAGNTQGGSYTLDMPPIADQETEGSCVGFAVGYAAMSYEMKRSSGLDYYFPLTEVVDPSRVASPEYMFNRTNVSNNDCRQGSYFIGKPSRRGALDFLMYEGITNMLETPYSPKNGCGTGENHKMPVSPNAGNFRIRNFAKVEDLSESSIKKLLHDKHPVIIGIETSPEFMGARGQYIWRNSSKPAGGQHGRHAVVIIGYDDSKGAFKIQNSWGTKWGDEGYGWIAYDHLPRAVFEAYIIHAGQLKGYEVKTPQYVSVYSEALYVTNVKLSYYLHGRKVELDKNISAFFSFEHQIPEQANRVKLEVNGIATLEDLNLDRTFSGGNIQACYKVWGSILDVEYAEVKCSY